MFLWPMDRTSAERAKSFLFVFLLGFVAFLEYCLFSCLECVLEVIATRTMLDRKPMEKENVIDDRTQGRGDLADRLHQLTEICTTTTSTLQVSWQHPLLENPIRHCKYLELLALYI